MSESVLTVLTLGGGNGISWRTPPPCKTAGQISRQRRGRRSVRYLGQLHEVVVYDNDFWLRTSRILQVERRVDQCRQNARKGHCLRVCCEVVGGLGGVSAWSLTANFYSYYVLFFVKQIGLTATLNILPVQQAFLRFIGHSANGGTTWFSVISLLCNNSFYPVFYDIKWNSCLVLQCQIHSNILIYRKIRHISILLHCHSRLTPWFTILHAFVLCIVKRSTYDIEYNNMV